MFEFNDTPTDFILISIGAIFAMMALVVVYYVLVGYNTPPRPSGNVKTNTANQVTTSNASLNGISPDQFPQVTPPSGMSNSPEAGATQVFNISDNVFTYDDAEAVCKAYGSELATYEQLVDAYKKGANWRNYGWVKGQMALFPIQNNYWQKCQETDDASAAESCGVPGINGGYFENKNMQFGVNCYGKKRGPKGPERSKDVFISDKERELRAKVAEFQKNLGKFKLLPFNEDKWGSCNV